jgi:hypothetical protein
MFISVAMPLVLRERDVSKVHTAFIFTVEEYAKQKTAQFTARFDLSFRDLHFSYDTVENKLRNVALSLNYKASRPIGSYPSESPQSNSQI